MSLSKQLKRELHLLFDKKMQGFNEIFDIRKVGKPYKFNRKIVEKSIEKIQDLASSEFVDSVSKSVFNQYAKTNKSKHIKGFGDDQKKKEINKWYDEKIKYPNCVYLFFAKDSKCLYIGRTTNGKIRILAHAWKDWFKFVKRIKVIATTSSNTPMIECLATHYYTPKYKKHNPSKSKWAKKCPICEKRSQIRKIIESTF